MKRLKSDFFNISWHTIAWGRWPCIKHQSKKDLWSSAANCSIRNSVNLLWKLYWCLKWKKIKKRPWKVHIVNRETRLFFYKTQFCTESWPCTFLERTHFVFTKTNQSNLDYLSPSDPSRLTTILQFQKTCWFPKMSVVILGRTMKKAWLTSQIFK